MKCKHYVLTIAAALLISACQSSDGFKISDTDDHRFVAGRATEDGLPLSSAVRIALKRDPQTMHQQISVSSTSEDTVRLVGFVPDLLTSSEAERIAGLVPGVRFVVNTLQIR